MHNKLKYLLFVSTVFLSATFYANTYGQDLPVREYTNPDEIVTFDKNTTYSEAIEVINQFVQEYENKFIVDQSGYAGNLGVSLPAMHWKDALKYILQIKRLQLVTYNDYYEIIVPKEKESQKITIAAPTNSNAGSGDTDVLADINTREVRINATFFEGNRRALQEVGIDWSTLTKNVPDNLNEIVGGEGAQGDNSIPQTTFSDQFVSVNAKNASNVSQNVFNALVNFGDVGGGVQVQALFSAFEADNMGKVLATPSIKVIDGNEGRIQVGQDFSIKQRDFAGNVTDEFFSTGTILTVTPTIINQNDTVFIYLDLQVERSTAQPDVVSTIINKQQAQTSSLLLNGEATSIAGLYRTEESKVRRGVPILKDLPGWFFGLKYLFGYNSTDYTENELIILVQAELEKPLKERINSDARTKRDILSDARNYLKYDLDRVFESPYLVTNPAEGMEKDTINTVANTFMEKTGEADVDGKASVGVPSDEVSEALTPAQKEIAKNLTMPVTRPDLMVVVPKAFSLEEYLELKDRGEQVDEPTDLKYFVIGGSFIIRKNAIRFNQTLENAGYDTRILYNPQSRFNYVAYRGFKNFEDAYYFLKVIRRDINNEAWLFTFDPSIQKVK